MLVPLSRFLSLSLSRFPRSITPPMLINIFPGTTLSLECSSSSSVKPSAKLLFLIPNPTRKGIHSRFPDFASRKIEPRYPPRTTTFPVSLFSGSSSTSRSSGGGS